MKATYVPSTNTATNGVALGATEDDVRVYKLLVGAPTSGANIYLYNITNPIGAASTNLAAKITLPTFSATNVNPGVYTIDLGPYGLPLPQGGNVQVDATVQLTVIWELADNSQK